MTSGLRYTLTSSVAENLITVLVETGGTFIVPEGVSATVTSFTTETGSVSNLSNSFTAETIALGGGRVNANAVTLTSTGDTTVSKSSSFSGILDVEGTLNVNSTLNGYNAKTGGTNLDLRAGAMNVSASGVISSAGLISSNGDDISISVTGNLVHNGQITTSGTSYGADAGNVTITSNHISGTGSFTLTGYRGQNGSYNSAHGKPGGDGGLLLVTSSYDSIDFSINVSGGTGGTRRCCQYNWRNGANGANGSYQFID